MRILRLGSFPFLGVLVFATTVYAQQPTAPAARDPQAVSVLTKCLTASGGAQAISAIQDFTATGNVTYFWAGEQVQGSVTVRGIGAGDFRLDANLPDGTRSWAVTGLDGNVKDATGKTTNIPIYNAIHLGSQTFPAIRVLAALNDPSISVSPLIIVTLDGQKLYKVHTQKTYSSTDDPTGDMSKWSVTDYFIDPTILILSEIQDTVRPSDGSRGEYQHETIFSRYQQMNGVLVPYSITEKIGGQETWTVQLSSVQFNTGLTDAEFHF